MLLRNDFCKSTEMNMFPSIIRRCKSYKFIIVQKFVKKFMLIITLTDNRLPDSKAPYSNLAE